MPQRPTIHSVARRAGVSKSLVSLVMRGSPQVKPDKREAVLAAARELGYRPNTVARSLVEGRTRTVGVLVSDLRNPWYVDILDGFRGTLDTDGMRVLIGAGQHGHRVDRSVVEAFLDMRVEGLCVLGSMPRDEFLVDAIRSVPTVVASSYDYDLPGVHTVVNDDVRGVRLAVDHLVELGHRRIAHLGGGDSGVGVARRRGYQQAMRAHGLSEHALVAECGYDERSGHDAAESLLRRTSRPTAIVALNDLACAGALSAAGELGLRVPGELSLVGYDNTSLAAMRSLSLSSVDPGNDEIGRLAARGMLERISAQDPASVPGGTEFIEPKLVCRDSSGPVPDQGGRV